ncbi:two-component system regulatory protein YycI [Bhargavaea ullalensis]|uniref:Regulatory protein YycI of two-component signal transduction system YycFG n=1 Tax=Bhargavaea ullalensis TaxID=1265685 RepID=A0ABV2GC85_9BACL
MDWSKTKTIFIIVFAILNVFLYSLYVNRYTELQKIEVLGETNVEDRLKLDGISYPKLPEIGTASYASGEVRIFEDKETKEAKGQVIRLRDDGKTIVSDFEKPVSIKGDGDKPDFGPLLDKYVKGGSDYTLWKIDEEKQEAVFFQKIGSLPVYFNKNSTLTVQWNDSMEATGYRQRMMDEIVPFNQEKDLFPPIQAINALYSRGFLKTDSEITKIEMGYSPHVQLTKTQVFAPTWHIHVKLKDGTSEDYFVNAVDGRILDKLSEQFIEEDG